MMQLVPKRHVLLAVLALGFLGNPQQTTNAPEILDQVVPNVHLGGWPGA